MINLNRRIVYRGDVYDAIDGARINTLYGVLNDKYMDGIHDGLKRALSILAYDVKDIPAADVVEVRHGKWTDHRTIEHDGEWYCTACGEEVTICSCGKDKTWKYRYCPNCGAKMDGGADDE